MNTNQPLIRRLVNNEHPLPVTALAELFGFPPEALEANRAGRLTEKQRQDMFYYSVGYLVRGLVMLVLGLTLIVSVAPLARRPVNQFLLALACGALLMLSGSWMAATYRILRPRVQVACGLARQAGDPAHPALAVGPVVLHIPYRRWKRLPAILPGEYCAYYGPTRSLLSIEPAPSEIAP